MGRVEEEWRTSILCEDLIAYDAYKRQEFIHLLQVNEVLIVEFDTRIRRVVERNTFNVLRSKGDRSSLKEYFYSNDYRCLKDLRVYVGYVEDKVDFVAAQLVELWVQRVYAIRCNEDFACHIK